MPLDQCAQNADGSLKDAQNIQWFYDADDTQPLSTAAPVQEPQPLGRGLCKRTTTRFSDALA